MKFKELIILLPLIIFLPPTCIYAHGVRGEVNEGGVVVSAEYDNGEPMSYARVKVSAPCAKLLFQSGRTDRNGRFCFFPDTPGDWKVVVDDEMGHRLEVMVPVNETKRLKTDEKANSAKSHLPRWEKALMGVAVIFGIFGILSLWKKSFPKK
jgi:nickel transport protein